jgi:GH24 family phage-related lysozyme (muramidase)
VKNPRLVIAALSLSAASFGGLLLKEGYTDTAIIPVKGDRPTVGFGSTFNDKGKPVVMGDTITAPQAVLRSLAHIAKDESAIKVCVTAPVSQSEYDRLVEFSYQYGTFALCRSSIVKHLNAGNYAQSCEAYKLFKFVAGYDCSILGNKRCWGVWSRSLARSKACTSALV